MSVLDFFEVYTNTGETNVFDHYVPRLLLKQWRIASNQGEIFRWYRPTGKVEKKGIGSVAGSTDWDLSKSKGNPSDFVRKKLFSELLEDKASRIIDLLNSSDIPDLTFLEESTLAIFMGHQLTRVPSFRLSLSHFFSLGLGDGTLQQDDFGDKHALVKKVARNGVGMTYERFLHETSPVVIEGGKPQIMLLSLIIASDIGERIYRGHLHILEIPKESENEFVISDNPVILLDFERQDLLRFVPWWEVGKKDIWIFMPISPKKAIFYAKGKRKNGSVENNNESLVQLFNFGQYLCCSNEVFARNEKILKQHLSMYLRELKRYRLLPSSNT